MEEVCKSILIVEDGKDHNSCFAMLSSDDAFDVKCVRKGHEVMDAIRDCMPSVVLMDISFPGNDGFDILDKIRNEFEFNKIKVLLFSSKYDENTILKGLSAGAYDFIRIPISQEELKYKIRNIIRLRDHELEVESLNLLLKKEKEQMENERNLLAKYFSRVLIDKILSGEISTEIGGKISTASVLFCDLRRSTEMAEKIEPDLFSKFLSNLFTDITDIIYGESGYVSKFLGDGILATFGIPEAMDEDAYKSARVAVKIRKYLSNFNQFKPKYLTGPIEMGIGIARGRLFSGNIGSVNQIEYTVLGDPVNIASRLEALTKSAGVDILVDGNIRNALDVRARVQKVKNAQIRGKTEVVEVYYLKELVM